MASITTRQTGTTGTNGVTRKNLPLTNTEIDTNFINLNDNKLEATWTGNTSIVTLGTVTTGTWNATTIGTTKGGTGLTSFTNGGAVYATSTSALTTGTLPIASGGTASTTASAARTALGLAIGTDVQAYDSDLAALAGLTSTGIVYRTGSGTFTAGDSLSSVDLQLDSLGVGTAASGTAGRIDSSTLVVSSTSQIASLGIGTAASGTAGEIRASNQITSYYSDERLKENVQIITNALDKVMSLRGVTYNSNQIAESFGFKNKEKQVGVLAGDVQKVLPEAVKPAPFDLVKIDENTEISRSGQNYQTVQYEKLVPLLIQAIKELNEQVQELKGIK
jgi:hypothetical protein